MFGFDLYHTSQFLMVSAFALWAVGAVSALLNGEKASDKVYSTVFGVGSALLTMAALCAWPLVSAKVSLDWAAKSPLFLGLAPFANHLDALSALFLLLLGVIGIAISAFSPGYLEHLKDRVNKG